MGVKTDPMIRLVRVSGRSQKGKKARTENKTSIALES
jgi:hypothetical protein